MRAPDNTLPADVRVIVGSMGTGKSQGVKDALRGEKTVLVFDVKNEYGQLPGFRPVYTRAEFLAAAKRGGRIAWPAPAAEFDFFTKVVWARGDCLCIAEELASLTTTAKARGSWHLILTQGRGYGIRTCGVAQRAMEIDKTIIGNATMMRVHRLSRADDRAYMAKELDVPRSLLDSLQGFEFVERQVVSGKLILPARLRKK